MINEPFSLMIIDDDAGDRKNARRAVKESGLPCDIVEAESIDSALQLCKSQEFQCAILDYHMPGQNGLKGISLLHKFSPYMSIIMATGQGDEEIATAAFKQGVSDYLPKRSINADSVRRIIESNIHKNNLKRKLEEQRQALENFALILVHDLSAPIRNIQGCAGLIQEYLKNKEYDKLGEYCNQMEKNSIFLQDFINTLQEYNKVTNIGVAFSEFALKSALEQAKENLNVIIEENNAVITHDQLPRVYGNMTLVTQLLQNLITNAVIFCHQDAPEIHISAEQKGSKYQISIKDNGVGIPKNAYKTVFSPFVRLYDNEKNVRTGLGLAICKKIIERHEGEIWCESEEGVGTTFMFTLDATKEG